jgi:hypothetical protein
VKKA